jgi:hypothetical protein
MLEMFVTRHHDEKPGAAGRGRERRHRGSHVTPEDREQAARTIGEELTS